MTSEAEKSVMQFDINQNDLDDGDQKDTLNTIKSPWKHNWVQTSELAEDDKNMINNNQNV